MDQAVLDLSLNLAQHIFRLHSLLTAEHTSGKLYPVIVNQIWPALHLAFFAGDKHAAASDCIGDSWPLPSHKIHVSANVEASLLYIPRRSIGHDTQHGHEALR